jgi:4-hydroxybenzoate polyprenyltransferase
VRAASANEHRIVARAARFLTFHSTVKKYFEFVKFSHTIFALPFALASMALAASEPPFGARGWPGGRIFLLILAAMGCARTTAMAFNRIVDRKFDALNPRTKDRHLPRGAVSLGGAWTLVAVSAAAFIGVTHFINPICFYLAPLALLIVGFYSFTKRFTALSHFTLGLSLAVAPVGAWLAVRGRFDWPPIVLAGAVVFWLAGFDIIYATLDEAFDRAMGLRSMVVTLGPKLALRAALSFHLVMMALLLAFGLVAQLGAIYFIGLAPIYVSIIVQHVLARKQDARSVNLAFFRVNAIVSVLVLLSVVADVGVRTR